MVGFETKWNNESKKDENKNRLWYKTNNVTEAFSGKNDGFFYVEKKTMLALFYCHVTTNIFV